MIQRIQTIYLLGALVCSLLLFSTAIATITTLNTLYNFSVWGLVNVTNSMNQLISSSTILLALNVIIGLVSLVTILTFKKRNIQLLLSKINIFLIVVLVGSSFYFLDNSIGQITEIQRTDMENTKDVNYALGAVLPVFMLIFTVMALTAIRKDEELVRSADRIR